MTAFVDYPGNRDLDLLLVKILNVRDWQSQLPVMSRFWKSQACTPDILKAQWVLVTFRMNLKV